ncbi:MAG: hypothetical protein QM731_03655 [Chitinophagaceae bacterium]
MNAIFTKPVTAILLLLILTFTACKKNEDDSGANDSLYYLRCKVDGNIVNFKYRITGIKYENEQGIHVEGSSIPDASKANTLSLSLLSETKSVDTGVYVENRDPAYLLGSIYVPIGQTTMYWSGNPNSEKPFTIKIASKDNGILTGTFEGALYETGVGIYGGTNLSKKILTEGEFKVPFN